MTYFSALQLSSESACKPRNTVTVRHREINLVSRRIASLSNDCATPTTEWTLTAAQGQKLNISLIDFKFNNTSRRASCGAEHYARIVDLTNHKTEPLCHNGVKNRFVTVTSGHSVKIYTPAQALRNENFIFSVKGE